MSITRYGLILAALASMSCEALFARGNNPKNCMVNPGICEAMGPGYFCDPMTERCETKGGCTGPVDCMTATAASCNDGQCVPCTADNQCNAWSSSRVLPTPLNFCVSGVCGNCRTNADCMGSPIGGLCDATTHTCRGCEAHSECDSAAAAGDGICRRPGDYPETPATGVETGKCVPSNLIAFATNKGSNCQMNSGNPSTLSNPYCNLTVAAMSGKPYIKVLPANHGPLTLTGANVTLVGPGRDAAQGAVLAGLMVSGGTVSVSDLAIQPGAGVAGVQCRNSGTLYLNYTKVTSDGAIAVDAQQDCSKVFVDRSRLESPANLAISIGELGTLATTYRVVNTLVTNSGGAGALVVNPVRLGSNASSGLFAYNTLSGTVGGVACSKSTQSLADSIFSVALGMAVSGGCGQNRLAIGTAELMAGADPKLTTSAANTTCCIDKGAKPEGSEVLTDYFGTKRPLGGGFDIGFHEVK